MLHRHLIFSFVYWYRRLPRIGVPDFGGGVVMKHPRLRSEKVDTTTFREMRLTYKFRCLFLKKCLLPGFNWFRPYP